MIKPQRLGLVCALFLSVCSCDNGGIGPTDKNQQVFSLTVSVVDANGNPVSGLIISAWNRITGLPAAKINPRTPLIQKVTSISTIGFEVPVASHVRIDAFELDDQLFTTIVDLPVAAAGRHSAQLSIQSPGGMRVFKCRLVATDVSSGSLLYRDSIYAVLWQNDNVLSIIGTTTSRGIFQTQDSLLFPNVLSLPPITMTAATDPTPLGTLHISDSVTVTLSDTVARSTQSYLCSIKRGSNDIRLVWTPGTTLSPLPEYRGIVQIATPSSARRAARPELAWKLEQNYPNPFN